MPQITLDIDSKLLTKNFKRISESTTRYTWIHGGAGSSKTYSIAQFLVLETYQPRAKGRTIYVLKYNQSKLENTIINDFYSSGGGGIVNSFGLGKHFKYNKVARELTNTLTGVSIKFMGAKDEEEIKGLTAPHIIFVDEVSDIKYKMYQQLKTRVRIEGAKFYFAFNPVDDEHWIKTKVFDVPENNRTIIHTTYHDNKSLKTGKFFITQDYIDELEAFKYTDYNHYRIYTLGEWGSTTPLDGRFYKDFNINKHQIKAPAYDREKPLHISFDFNVNPYMTCTVWQVDGNKIYQIDEILTKYPNNNTPSCVRTFAKKYRDHDDTIFFYGDPAGKHKDTRNERRWNDFDYIQDGLDKAGFTDVRRRVKSSADRLTVRGTFINKVFREEIEDLRIFVDESCTTSVKDYLNLLEDSEGKKHKAKEKDENGVSYEKYGHTSDANDYFICYYFEKYMRAMRGRKRTRIVSGK